MRPPRDRRMLARVRQRAADSVAACSVIVRSPNLRRAEAAFGLMWAGEWAAVVAVGVIAFRHGGAAEVGAVGFARMIPAAVVAPVASTLADRARRERVLGWIGVIRTATLGASGAVAAAGGPVMAIYVGVAAATVAQTLFRPAHSALLPTLCSTPAELTAANVIRGFLDSAATLIGPLVAALLLSASGPAAVLAAAAAASALAGWLAQAVTYERPPRIAATGPRVSDRRMDGLRAIATDGMLARLTALTSVQTFTRGALTVFSVVAAIDLLRGGSAGVGLLMAAMGAGALAGSASAALLVGGGSLARWFGIGVALWGAPLVTIGLLAHLWLALIMFAIVGVGNALVDVGVFTLLARLADDAILARVYGAFEGIITAGVAAGALAASVLIGRFGVETSLVVIGLVAPTATLVSWQGLATLDHRMRVRDADVALLQRIPILRPLPQATIEQLAGRLGRVEFPEDAIVFAQGDTGDEFYVIERGAAVVLLGGQPIRRLGLGDGFGEIALIRNCRRTASIQASAPLTLRTLSRRVFVTAVIGYSPSAEAADRVIAGHLTGVSA